MLGSVFARIAVRLDHAGVREGFKENVPEAQVEGGLQDPTLRRPPGSFLLPLQELQHLLQVTVGGAQVLAREPGDIAWGVHERLGHPALEGVLAEHDLFIGSFGVPGVDRCQYRLVVQDPLHFLLRCGDARIIVLPVFVSGKWGGPARLPPKNRVDLGVAGEQPMQPSSSGASEARHHQRFTDLLIGDFGIAIEIVLGDQSSFKTPDEPRVLCGAAYRMKIGFFLDTAGQNFESLAKSRRRRNPRDRLPRERPSVGLRPQSGPQVGFPLRSSNSPRVRARVPCFCGFPAECLLAN